MYCKIELIPKYPIENGDVEYIEILLWRFLCSLERNGQILKDYTPANGKNYSLYVTFPKNDSFDEKYDSVYVKRDREKINELFDIEITELGENLKSKSYCQCKSRTAIEMQTYDFDIDSVFTCCDCGKPIVLYELPFFENEDSYMHIQDWQENYAAMHMLWVQGFCDRYTGNQLVKYDSLLNKQGIAIAEYMSKQLGCKVYYNMFDDLSKKIKRVNVCGDSVRVCPKCGNPMKHTEFSKDYKRDICDKCNLSSDRD